MHPRIVLVLVIGLSIPILTVGWAEETALDRGRQGEEEYQRELYEYRQWVANTSWTRARQVRVANPARVDQTLAVVLEVNPKAGTAQAVVDEQGHPIISQADDLDGDGAADEVSFLLPLKANQERAVTLLSASLEGMAAPTDLHLRPHEAGSWEPIRMQPTCSPATTQHSTYLSPTNAARARQIMARLDRKVPLQLIECEDFRLLLGEESGLIEGMRPGSIPEDYTGSFLREFRPDGPEKPRLGRMSQRFAGPVRCGFEWPEAGRRITVYRNGAIDTHWAKGPPALQIIACAYPYRYLATGSGDAVRFSQMLEMGRDLPGGSRMNLFGRGDASLRIEAQGLRAIEHQVWIDGGEIGWEVALDHAGEKVTEDPHERVARLCGDTYIAGGMHVISWNGDEAETRVRYRIADLGEQALPAGTGLLTIPRDQGTEADVPTLPEPESPPIVEVQLERRQITVNRLFPNHFNGWELRPLKLAQHNPQPAYFAAEVRNHSPQEADITFSLDLAEGILEATLLSERKMLEHDFNEGSLAPHFEREVELEPGGEGVTLTIPPGTTLPIEFCLHPQEDALGLVPFRLRWTTAARENQAELEILVQPTLLYMPVYPPMNELGREYANNCWSGKPPLIYDLAWYGGLTPERTLWNQAKSRDFERHGFWTVEPVQLRAYFTFRDSGQYAFYQQQPLDWAVQVAKLFADPACADYRSRVYLHDEIWEIFGGYKGRWRHLSEIIDLDRILLRNSPTPAWPSFQEPAIDPPFKYHLKLPNDIAEVFYYCGRDERLQEYARKLVEPRQELFATWCADPGFWVGAGTDHPRPLFAFWISTQLHVNKYTSVRRQIWWLRHQGIDIFNSWAFSGGYSPYANRILHWLAMPANTSTGTKYLLTDRGLAWMDMKEDMDLVTLVRLLREQVEEETTQARLESLAETALEASQRNDFEQARHLYVEALKSLRPDLAYLAPRDLYQGPVSAQPLPDLFQQDGDLREAQKIPEITLPLLEETGIRPPPMMDGQVDNAYLEQGATLEMREATQGGKLKAPTSVYLARDRGNLYVLFHCNEPLMDQLRAQETERDGAVYGDDCVEVFVDRAGDGKTVLHFIVNSIGTKFDRLNEDLTWNPDYEAAPLTGEESWTAELKIPFAILGGPPPPGTTWRLNFCRERKADSELGAWSTTFGAFNSPPRFGKVQFP